MDENYFQILVLKTKFSYTWLQNKKMTTSISSEAQKTWNGLYSRCSVLTTTKREYAKTQIKS